MRDGNPVPEWITRAQADGLMLGILILGIVAAIAAAMWARSKGKNPLVAAFGFGGPLIVAGLLWHLYNLITNKLGLDSVANLLVNLLLFAAVGIGFGLSWRRIMEQETGKRASKP